MKHEVQQAPNGGGTAAEGWSPKTTLDLLTAIGAAAGFFYALGIVVLAIQLWATYRFDFATTWHAATLVPPNVVLGQGMRVLWYSWFLLPALLFSLFVAARYRDPFPTPSSYAEAQQARERLRQYRLFGPIAAKWPLPKAEKRVLVIFGAWIIVMLVLFGYQALIGQPLAALMGVLRFGVSLVTTVVIGGVIMHVITQGHQQRLSRLSRSVRLFAVFYVFALLLVLLSGQLNTPPLTVVELEKDGVTTERGRLLSHGDGYWHLIAEPDGNIVSIRDEDVSKATVPK